MVQILPLNGLTFNREKINDISKVLAPPYDIISNEQKDNLKKSSPYNVVNLTLPDDTENKNKYKNAAEILNTWIDRGILEFDARHCFYLIEESFLEKGKRKSFIGFTGLLKVEDYKKGKVLRHEKTLPKPKEDRLNLLKTCRTNFEFIYTIYNDDDKSVYEVLKSTTKNNPVISTSVDYDKSLSFNFWKISDKNTILKITDLMKPKTILIADGHHRYETSRLYRELIKAKERLKETAKKINKTSLQKDGFKPEDYILALFVAGNQNDIIIHPTHRAVKFNKLFLPEEFMPIINKYFKLENLENPSEYLISKKMHGSSLINKKSLVIYLNERQCYFITLKFNIKDIYKNLGILDKDFNEDFENLDVNLLHKFLLGKLLDYLEIKDIKFVHTIKDLLKIINRDGKNGCYDAGFILNAPSIETVEKLSSIGLIMPQKSTYFYPKPCSGLVMYKLDR